MSTEKNPKKLKKQLSLINVYAIATGTTLSAGFFLLPGIAAAQVGPAITLAYIIAAIPLIPAMCSMMELATAMPKAGGAYYFLDRSMGPLVGTIGGLGTWLSLMLKTAFALIGVGAYLDIFFPSISVTLFAVSFALLFGIINLIGSKETGSMQVFLVGSILILLGGFVVNGVFEVDMSHFDGYLDAGSHALFSTAGLVYISYVGVTKVASVAEEVKNPERNLPLGMFLAFGTAMVIYCLGTFIMVGTIPMEELRVSLTPVALAAENILGFKGKVFVTIAAIFAFFSVANAGILSASRYPMAMSRDHLMPTIFRQLNKKNLPANSIYVTTFIVVCFILFLNPLKIAKLASAFQLLMFALCCLAVIIMRESKIEAYDPGYHSPFYPWTQIFGILASFWLIDQMGWMTILFSVGLILVGGFWYFWYARDRVVRRGAILHVFQRLGQYRHEGLEPELRGIMKEKGLRVDDPFDQLISRAQVLEISGKEKFDKVIKKASKVLSDQLSYPAEKIEREFLEGTKVGGTPTAKGVALPHMRLHHLVEPEILLIRSKDGLDIDLGKEFWGDHKPEGAIQAVFFLVSPESNPKQHLRMLAKLAGRVDDESFMTGWLRAENEQQLKEILLRDEHFISMTVRTKGKSQQLVGKSLKDIQMPADTLVAVITRAGKTIVPGGDKVLMEGDRITIIGEPQGIEEFRQKYYVL